MRVVVATGKWYLTEELAKTCRGDGSVDVGAALTGPESVVAAVRALRPDVLVMTAGLERPISTRLHAPRVLTGLVRAGLVGQSATRALVVSATPHPFRRNEMREAGASGFLFLGREDLGLLDAVHSVHRGEAFGYESLPIPTPPGAQPRPRASSAATGGVRVVFADRHPAWHRGMESWLAGQPGIDLVAAATTAPDTIAAVRREKPDVLVMDLLHTGESAEVMKALGEEGLIGRSGTRVIPHTAVDCRNDWGMSALEGAFGGHACNHVSKAAERDVLAKAIAAATG